MNLKYLCISVPIRVCLALCNFISVVSIANEYSLCKWSLICIDVLEHIPQADLPRIIKEIFDYSGKYVFATAAVKEAGKTLPNGMNAHATVQPEEWWNELFAQYYEDPYKKFTLDFTTKKTKRNSSDIYNL